MSYSKPLEPLVRVPRLRTLALGDLLGLLVVGPAIGALVVAQLAAVRHSRNRGCRRRRRSRRSSSSRSIAVLLGLGSAVRVLDLLALGAALLLRAADVLLLLLGRRVAVAVVAAAIIATAAVAVVAAITIRRLVLFRIVARGFRAVVVIRSMSLLRHRSVVIRAIRCAVVLVAIRSIVVARHRLSVSARVCVRVYVGISQLPPGGRVFDLSMLSLHSTSISTSIHTLQRVRTSVPSM